ncbi:hypothetical protein TRICI_004255 [Trichomonascus ciferrii]|uniref:T-complex protein 11 n=1 Tax=Trichomonascus ciferrii TaxID=44093 RepID=A0A642V1F9_9ASCO|nr:hypothetical protein TRICI_004255 [Trichomonascus ciferrii]
MTTPTLDTDATMGDAPQRDDETKQQPAQQPSPQQPQLQQQPQPQQAPAKDKGEHKSPMMIKNSSSSSSSPTTKRHRIRSRSMPNLIYYDACAKIHKHQHQRSAGSNTSELILNPKYLSTSSLPSPKSSTKKHHHSKRQQQHSPGLLPPATSCPNAPIQPPPVNSQSLREIDLQEIFKNPQLRHDIIFDPQLQFRPNLDGERGKRKRILAERYWDSIVAEFDALAATPGATLKPHSKLPLLFHTLRDILLSLLPLKDRGHVDAILDPDLVIQQIRHCALDFLSLAQWLADVFKAHCAPMRDSWVDQMVARIRLGIDTRSARRLVEGLRMTFAILEAMKLDVANHQIRTLRPMLVDTAIDFEQDYYTQIMDKGKISLSDSLDWYKCTLARFKNTPLATQDHVSTDINRCGFVWGLLRLLSCASEDLVAEFPSSFGFDFSRLASFRAELRRVVCLHLCVCLYQQMLQAGAAQNPQLARQALQRDRVQRFKQDLLAIIEDSLGNSKWTKNTQLIALETVKRVQRALGVEARAPDPAAVDMAYGWLSKHLQPKSDVYRLVEQKTVHALFDTLSRCVSVLSPLDSTTTCTTHCSQDPAGGSSPVHREILSLADRVLVLIRFHWGVFGKFYVTYLSLEQGSTQVADPSSQASACVLATSTVPHNKDADSDDDEDVKRQLAAQIRHQSTSTC